MKGIFVTNKYYNDNGMTYVFESLNRAFGKIPLVKASPQLIYGREVKKTVDADFAIFWDKDALLAAGLERQMKVFNSGRAIEICDDKQLTYLSLDGIADIPKTVSAPVMYDVNSGVDEEFLQMVADELGFPVVVKENKGSQGRQVFLAANTEELRELYLKLRHIPHHYQRFTGKYGEDIRIYTVGGRAVAACKRQGTDFRSNLAAGGIMELVDGSDYFKIAEAISKKLSLDYGAIDFLVSEDLTFLEANSNAYFRGIEKLGIDISGGIARYITDKMR